MSKLNICRWFRRCSRSWKAMGWYSILISRSMTTSCISRNMLSWKNRLRISSSMMPGLKMSSRLWNILSPWLKRVPGLKMSSLNRRILFIKLSKSTLSCPTLIKRSIKSWWKSINWKLIVSSNSSMYVSIAIIQ